MKNKLIFTVDRKEITGDRENSDKAWHTVCAFDCEHIAKAYCEAQKLLDNFSKIRYLYKYHETTFYYYGN